ncbi:UDP-4-amino-4,6-dideoxy-N-acetyl-beta-L-altrosamine transaminase [Cognatiyoonia sp. IB215446]|uniref:UDP-4-amino-4, 6-dideoxy-N-acetyl-beta-L-altrosamine transaminase n=1 Tax=Cognatiyoonia sp. IB215446 TaxID=3097355 RepID=UPI002A1202FA|nr:UDP-4-amino-4,6-dideoxy-N-acetyl-beta-L-altrosamine transaminase [Cognatiyoonia sp. IB215446]MDX8349436.1 UDP-4-amino-4,6-dideoxy-N-acetyl-beta-L-altrosamine transaminase [Cognatiyoonia sp. IB215446]
MIPYGRQDITEADIEVVVETLRSDFVTQGPAIPRFEDTVSRYCGAAGAIAVTSATAALHVAYRALDIGPGSLVWTVPNTFAATANAALYCGADVDFVDIDISDRNISIPALREKLEAAALQGSLPDLVVPVHFSGLSCDMAQIGDLAQEFGFRVVEDASHAIGGSYGADKVGCCRHSDATVFSFHPVKLITTGEGGIITSASTDVLERCALLRSHGITRSPDRLAAQADDPWYYEMIELGFNYRMTDIQAALGTSQMGRLDSYVVRRNEIAALYEEAFSETGLGRPSGRHDVVSARHLYTVHWPDGLGDIDRRAAFMGLRAAGIGVNVHYIPVHQLPYYRGLGFSSGQFPAAEAHYAQAISLPMFPTMTAEETQKVITTVNDLAVS